MPGIFLIDTVNAEDKIMNRLELFSFLMTIGIHLINGHSLEENDPGILIRHKRNVYSCESTKALLKYKYVTGHTACLSASVSLDVGNSGVSQAEQEEIVTQHNTYRALTDATDMTYMSWDVEVAFLAQKWADTCQTQHDEGYKRKIPGRFGLGQNLAYSINAKISWTAAIKLWHDEIKDFIYNSDTNVFSAVGHYTQLVWANSIKIGCGYAKCGSTHMYTCNYGPPGNFNVKTPFKAGTKCADCPNNCSMNLCNCNIVCLNGGTINRGTCTCSCDSGYSGPDCSLECSRKTDPSYCASSYTLSGCAVYDNVPSECPHMCGFCPNAGTAITGVSDGKGIIPFHLSDSNQTNPTNAATATTSVLTSSTSGSGSSFPSVSPSDSDNTGNGTAVDAPTGHGDTLASQKWLILINSIIFIYFVIASLVL